MNIKTTKRLFELKDVLKDPLSENEELEESIYWVFSDITKEQWKNMTVTKPGKISTEFPKTYGHYHATSNTPETYKLISGKGIFMLQKKHYENEVWVPEMVDAVYLIVGETAGDTVVITNEYGHSWSNIGNEPLVTFDDWNEGHTPADYEPIKKLKGMAYYLVEQNGNVDIVPNPNYKNLPKPQWVTPKEFVELQGK